MLVTRKLAAAWTAIHPLMQCFLQAVTGHQSEAVKTTETPPPPPPSQSCHAQGEWQGINQVKPQDAPGRSSWKRIWGVWSKVLMRTPDEKTTSLDDKIAGLSRDEPLRKSCVQRPWGRNTTVARSHGASCPLGV